MQQEKGKTNQRDARRAGWLALSAPLLVVALFAIFPQDLRVGPLAGQGLAKVEYAQARPLPG